MTYSELRKCIRYWQNELNLKNWRIRAFVQKNLGSQGRVYWEAKLKDATILIDPKTDDPWQKVVIHELLHLHLAWLGDPKPNSNLEYRVERAVESTAWALYNSTYDNQKPK